MKKQKAVMVTQSNVKVEYKAITQGIWELILVREKILRIHSCSKPALMFSILTTKSAISTVHSLVQHDWIKHVRIDQNFIRRKTEDKRISLTYISFTGQEADILTKPMCNTGFELITSKLEMKDIYDPAWVGVLEISPSIEDFASIRKFKFYLDWRFFYFRIVQY